MLKSISLAIVALLFASITYGQITWQPLNGPTGASYMKILAVDSSGRIFLYLGDELLTSIDNGENWVNSSNGLIGNEIFNLDQIIVFSSGKVVVSTIGKYYEYDSASNSWSLDIQLLQYGDLSFDNQHRLWKTGIWGGVFYSTDDGQSFITVVEENATSGQIKVMANYNDLHNLLVISKDGIDTLYHFTTDGTLNLVTETTKTIGFLNYSPFSATAFMSQREQNSRSTDGGLTWSTISLKFDSADTTFTGIRELYYESATKIWALTNKGIFISEDDGINWTAFLAGLYIDQFYRKMDGTLFLTYNCSDHDFVRSIDQGNTWSDLSSLFKYPEVNDIIVAKNGTLYTLSCYAYDRSNDGGQSWQKATLVDTSTTRITTLTAHPDGDLFSLSHNRKIIRSSDGGNNWTAVVQPDTTSAFTKIQADPFGNLYAFYSYPPSYKSTDKGQTWQPIKYSLSESNNASPLFHPNGDIHRIDEYLTLYYAADQDSTISEPMLPFSGNYYPDVYKSTITAQGNILFISDNFSFFNPQSEVYRYMGNGVVEKVNFPGGFPLDIVSAPNGSTFITSNDSLYESDNGGLQWSYICKLPKPLYPYYGQWEGVYVGIDNYLYLSYYHDVIYRSSSPISTRDLITGQIWYDENNNCIKDPNETPLVNHYVQAQGNGDYGGFSYTDGTYRIFAPAGDYQVSAAVPNTLFQSCPPVNVTVDTQTDTVYANVALQAVAQCPYLRVSASTPLLRRCFPNTYTVRYSNEGTATATNAYVEITLDSFFIFQSASINPTTQSGQTLTFDVGNVEPGTSGQIWIQVEVSCMAALLQEHCFKAQIFPDTPCLPALADLSVAEECQANIGSFDPNDKRAFVDGKEEPGAVLPDKSIEYLIRFQNTGTDTAFTIIVEDRISGVLDLASVTPLVSSHPFRMELGPERNLRFIFDEILLPDSNINEAASHGFIKFAVRQLPNLPSGTAIRNNADIYFDFNAPVITNTSELVVTRPTGTYEPTPGYSAQAFPNPFHDVINFRITGPNTLTRRTLLLTDALGRVIQRKQFAGNDCQLSREGLPTGMYFFAILSENGQWIAAGRVMAD